MNLSAIVALSVRRRGVVLAIWAAVLVFALFSIRKLSVDAVPDVTNIQVSVLTTAPGLSPAGGRAVPDLPRRDGDERHPGSRPDPVDQPDRRLGRHHHFPGRYRSLARAAAGQRAAQAGRERHPARLRAPGAGAGVDGARRDLRVLSDVEASLADGAEDAARLGGRAEAARRPRGRRGQRHGGRGQAVPGGPGFEAPGRLPPVAGRRAEHPRAQQRREGRWVHREEPGVVLDPWRRPVPQRRGYREHRRHLRRGRHAGDDQEPGDGEDRRGPAVRRRHQEGRGGDRRRHGHDAHRRQLPRGGERREGEAGRDPARAPRRGGDSVVLRPRRVHRADAEDGRHQSDRGGRAGGDRPLLDARELPRRSDRRAGHPALHGDRADRHGAAGRHRQPDVPGGDRLRPAGRRRHRHVGSGADRGRGAPGPDPGGRRLPGRRSR